jgi:hypothetical protein
MPFTGDILNYRSVAVVGTAKNTGKTECLNYIIRQLQSRPVALAITSVGIDGESCDQVTRTPKPEIDLYSKMVFVTSETHFRQRRFSAEILDVSGRSTSLGRLVTARALEPGKVLLSGPSDTGSLAHALMQLRRHGVDLTLVDGALSRKSLGSPTVTDAMILNTGAAFSANMPTLVRKTKFLCDLIALPAVHSTTREALRLMETLCAVNSQGRITDLGTTSVMGLDKSLPGFLQHGTTLFVPGAVTDKLLQYLIMQKEVKQIRLIVRDFTRIFASQETVQSFLNRGGKMEVLYNTKLIALCINPTAPDGTLMNSDALRDALSEKTSLPVWDIKKLALQSCAT